MKESYSFCPTLNLLYNKKTIKKIIFVDETINYIEVVLTFYFVKIERNSYLCISEPSVKFLSCTKYWTKIQ